MWDSMESLEGKSLEGEWNIFRTYGREDGEPVWFPETTKLIQAGINPFVGFGKDEFSEILAFEGASEDQISELWNMYDLNLDGTLDAEEAEEAVGLWKKFRPMFAS